MQSPKYHDCQILSGNEHDKPKLQKAINLLLNKGYELIDFAAVPNNATGYHGTCLYTAVMAQRFMKEESAGPRTKTDFADESTESDVYSINCSDRQSVKFTEPVRFMLDGRIVNVGAWNNLVVQLCELLQAKNSETFPKVLDHFGSRRFSHNFPPEVAATRINDTKIFINTVFSAEHAKSTAMKLITLFEYDKNALVIYLRDRPKNVDNAAQND